MRAREEFETLVGYFAGLEARAYYAEALMGWQEWDRCRALVDEGNLISKRMPGASRDINRQWITRLTTVESALPGQA